MSAADGQVLYVGKAKNLRNRVRSYFSRARDARFQIRFLMERVAAIDFVVTNTEKEALILENTLIKRHRPRYNIDLRDDKTYFSLRLDPREEFPRLTIVRKVPRDGARYFGPYASATAAREVLRQLYRLFPLRHYPLATCRQRKRPCLFHQLRQCSAPCHGLITPAEYATLVDGATLFLDGRDRELVRSFEQRMVEAAKAERYEEAAKCRDLVRAIQVTVERQNVVGSKGDLDVLGYARAGEKLELTLLHLRGGALIGSRTYAMDCPLEDEEGIASFLRSFYGGDTAIPDQLLLPCPLPEMEAFAGFLSELRGNKVAISYPRRGDRMRLVELAMKNAAAAARERHKRGESGQAALRELQERLGLDQLPLRIECYDISTIQGKLAVGSGVTFHAGEPDKAGYRRYRIRGVVQADDFAMLHEVLSRRFAKGKKVAERPDLIVVDGGIGQLNVLLGVLRDLGVAGVATAALAKSRVVRDVTGESVVRSEERVFLPGRKNPLTFRRNSPALLLLSRIRDEAHRFAIEYHRQVRSRGGLVSTLDGVAGIGPVRKREVLRHFGSMRRLQGASREELHQLPGFSATLADSLWRHLHGNDEGG